MVAFFQLDFMDTNLRGIGGCYLSRQEIEEIIPTLKGPELQLYLQLKGLAASNSPIYPAKIANQLGFSLTTYYRYLKRLKQKELLTATKQVRVVSFVQFHGISDSSLVGSPTPAAN